MNDKVGIFDLINKKHLETTGFIRPMGVLEAEKGLNPCNCTFNEETCSKRDNLPTEDVEMSIKHGLPDQFVIEQAKYHQSLKDRGIDNKNKFFGVDSTQCCAHPNKYKNIISNSLKFWSCKNCGADLGDIND